MESLIYPAIFEPDNGAVSVSFPDLQGCISYGDNAEHAYEMAKEALGGYMASHLEYYPAPKATPVSDLKLKKSEFAMLVEVEPIYLQELNRKSVRINASIPAWLKIAAEKNGVNVSQTLQRALKAELDYAN